MWSQQQIFNYVTVVQKQPEKITHTNKYGCMPTKLYLPTQEQTKTKVSRRKEIMNIRTEINKKIGTKKQ